MELYGSESNGRNKAKRIKNAVPIKRCPRGSDGIESDAEGCRKDGGELLVLDGSASTSSTIQTWGLEFIEKAFGETEMTCANIVPPNTLDGNSALSLKLRARDFLRYCAGDENLITEYEAKGGLPFQSFGWQPFAGTKDLRRLLEKVATPQGLAFEDPLHTFLDIAPMDCATCLHSEGNSPVCLLQMAGRTQYVLYAPEDCHLIYGNEAQERLSIFDPFSPDWTEFPRACTAKAHVVVLEPGDCLCIPENWWYSWKALDLVVHAKYVYIVENYSKGKQPSGQESLELNGADDSSKDVHERAMLYKQNGNRDYAYGRFREACAAYTRAIEMLTLGEEYDDLDAGSSSELCVLFCNRAQCWLKRKMWSQAIEDCNRILRTGRSDDITLKALYRRAKALEGLGDAENAERDFRRVLELQPHNVDARAQVENYSSVLYRMTVLARATPELRRRQGAPTH